MPYCHNRHAERRQRPAAKSHVSRGRSNEDAAPLLMVATPPMIVVAPAGAARPRLPVPDRQSAPVLGSLTVQSEHARRWDSASLRSNALHATGAMASRFDAGRIY